MTKAPTPTEMSKGQSDNTNNATKKFEVKYFHPLKSRNESKYENHK